MSGEGAINSHVRTRTLACRKIRLFLAMHSSSGAPNHSNMRMLSAVRHSCEARQLPIVHCRTSLSLLKNSWINKLTRHYDEVSKYVMLAN